MQQLLFDLFSDRIYFPDELTAGFPSAHAALTQRGWPRVTDMRGKIVFNLNLFSSNAACKPLYFGMGGASYVKRLEFSDGLAEQWTAADDEARPPTRAAPKAWAEARQRKVFFNRGTIEEAKLSNTTATMEVTSETVAREPWMLHQGFVTRFRTATRRRTRPPSSTCTKSSRPPWSATMASGRAVRNIILKTRRH